MIFVVVVKTFQKVGVAQHGSGRSPIRSASLGMFRVKKLDEDAKLRGCELKRLLKQLLKKSVVFGTYNGENEDK